jgi:hypothetical protein
MQTMTSERIDRGTILQSLVCRGIILNDFDLHGAALRR